MTEPKKRDFIEPLGLTNDGAKVGIRHKPDEPETLVVVNQAQDGKPILGELITMKLADDGMYDVQTVIPPQSKGPSKAVTKAYRANYDTIFGKRPVGQA